MNISGNKTLTVVAVDANGNSPAVVDGANSWEVNSITIPNGTTLALPFFNLTIAGDGNSAALAPTSAGGPTVVNVSNVAGGAPIHVSESFTVLGYAVALNLLVS